MSTKTEAVYALAMLVDDNDIDNYIHQRIIRNLNFAREINVFTSAVEALDILKNDPARYPDIIFIDLNIPVMDGFSFIRELKKIQALMEKTKLVILTSSIHQEDEDLARTIDQRIIFLKKPLVAEMLTGI